MYFHSIPVGLHSGHIAALPKDVFDPRRVIELTNEMKLVLCNIVCRHDDTHALHIFLPIHTHSLTTTSICFFLSVHTHTHREEGLPPYVPEMAVKPGTFINYNRTVSLHQWHHHDVIHNCRPWGSTYCTFCSAIIICLHIHISTCKHIPYLYIHMEEWIT